MKTGDIFVQQLPHITVIPGAIESIQGSPWTHCGIIYQETGWRKWLGSWWVIEAFPVAGVWEIPYWVARWRFLWGKFELRSLPIIGKEVSFVNSAQVLLGKKYNLAFRWGNDAVYCSELIYEAFASATGTPMCHLDILSTLKYKPWLKDLAILQNSATVDLTQLVITVKDIYENSVPTT